MSEQKFDSQARARLVIEGELDIQALFDDLSGASRRMRQNAASTFKAIVEDSPKLLLGNMRDFADALNRPEAQTRWEILDVLTILMDFDSRGAEIASQGAEASLFDEESGTVRLAAMRYFCKLGATTEMRSEKYWPLIDEAIQCYHGDYEFPDMLIAVTNFAGGKLAPTVKQALTDRMAFDAENGKGALRKRATTILEAIR